MYKLANGEVVKFTDKNKFITLVAEKVPYEEGETIDIEEYKRL